jgi:redox-sensing transcriptional repressor
MKSPTTISKATIDRLPLYFRTLRLAQDEGLDIISSDELGRRLGITPEQIRKELKVEEPMRGLR